MRSDYSYFHKVFEEYVKYAGGLGADLEVLVLEGLSEDAVETMKQVALRYFADAILTDVVRREFDENVEEVLKERPELSKGDAIVKLRQYLDYQAIPAAGLLEDDEIGPETNVARNDTSDSVE